MLVLFVFFFFKQKTAYEMRISDWSSDVCSSDLPLAWLLSATLARRMDNLPVAQEHIAQAVALSPDDASVALEEGNIAVLSGMDDVAKLAWERAVKVAPDSPAGKAATASLAQLRSEEHTSELQSLMRISYAVFCLQIKHPSHTNLLMV